MSGPAPTADRRALAALFQRNFEAHAYGLADLEEPYWSASRWWRRGDAALGAIDIGDDGEVVYAVSPADPAGTLDLLAEVSDQLPERWVATGPIGMAERLSGTHDADWSAPHVKMQLSRPERLPEPDPRVVALDRTHVPAMSTLFAETHDASSFFVPDLVDSGHYLGIFEGDELIAVGGVHVASSAFDIVAIGNVATRPSHRRTGLGRAVVATLSHRLRAQFAVVTLNVATDNQAARDLYEELGYADVHRYEEAELVRRA